MDEQDKQLDEIMKRRDIPKMRSNLSERIIDAAQKTPQKASVSVPGLGLVQAALEGFINRILLPRPAIVMAGVLVFGLAIGIFMQDATEVPEEDLIFLYVENSFLFEDWL